MKLYELPESLMILDDLIDQDALDDDMLGVAMDTLGNLVEDKMDGIARLVKNWKAESDAISDEIVRLRDRQASLDNQMRRLKDYALGCLRAANTRKVKLPIVTAYIGTSKSVQVDVDADALPEAYRRVVVSADKTALKKALDGGETIDGVSIVESEYLVLR
jgi:hypothetical protein